MREQSPPFFVGIDVGTAFIRCVVGSIDEQGVPEIIGHSSVPATGVRRGVVTHPEEVASVLRTALDDAERIAGKSVTSATVNVNGSHVSGVNSQGVIAISAGDRVVSEHDRVRVEEAAAVINMPANREIVQIFPKSYSLDGQGNIKDPVGMKGVRLEVDTHIVTASTPNVRSLEVALNSSGVDMRHKAISSLASAEAVLNRQQREAGTAVVDIGAGTTNIIIVEDGEVQHVSVIPVGGTHVTNDLAIGLKTDLDIAEKVKVEHATLNETTRSTASVVINKKQHTFKADLVQLIVEARMDELIELIEKQLRKAGKAGKLPGGVIFTGGGSKITGLDGFAKEKMQLPSRIATLLPVSGLLDVADDVAYATPIGLMLLDMLLGDSDQPNSAGEAVYSDAMSKVSGLFAKLKRS